MSVATARPAARSAVQPWAGTAAAVARRGYAVVRGLVPPDTLRVLRAASDDLLATVPPGTTGTLQIVQPSRMAPAFAHLLRDEELFAPARAALDTVRLQLLQEVLLCKGGGTDARIPWHRDATYFGYLKPLRALSMRIALAPCGRGSGGLVVIAGSHRWTAAAPPPDAASAAIVVDALAAEPPERRAQARRRRVRVDLQPGDVSLHAAGTLHASGPNREPHLRPTLVLHLFDGDCTLDPARLPPGTTAAGFPTDARGHLGTDAFPVLARGEAVPRA